MKVLFPPKGGRRGGEGGERCSNEERCGYNHAWADGFFHPRLVTGVDERKAVTPDFETRVNSHQSTIIIYIYIYIRRYTV